MNSKDCFSVNVATGTLNMELNQTPEWPYTRIVDFAARANLKRGFLFVSKVLGKHLPSKISEMEAAYKFLSDKVKADNKPTLFISMAETGTGLGYGIYESFKRDHYKEQTMFWHSSRYSNSEDSCLNFEESHSHAPSQWMCMPHKVAGKFFVKTTETLVLIDDEISTGNTFRNLFEALKKSGANRISKVILLTLTDFSGLSQKQWEDKFGIEIECHSIINGGFTFDFSNPIAPEVVQDTKTTKYDKGLICRNLGRYGMIGIPHVKPVLLDYIESLATGQNVLVLGYGEFMYPSMIIGRELEKLGKQVSIQSTTRSPILVDTTVIKSKLMVPDSYHENVPHFLYNLDRSSYDHVILIYEQSWSADLYRFCEQNNIIPVGVSDDDFTVY